MPTDIMPAITTLEFFAGLTTGALASETVKRTVRMGIKSRTGGG